MTAFRSFASDFPTRCKELLAAIEGTAAGGQRDVTAALVFAAAAITIPFERLRPGEHPARDRDAGGSLKESFDGLMRAKFLASELAPSVADHSWKYGRLASTHGDPSQWPEIGNQEPLKGSVRAKDLMWHLRTALAHGNIFFTKEDPIQQIIFLAKDGPDSPAFKYLSVSPSDFKDLLGKWLSFFAGRQLPADVIDTAPASLSTSPVAEGGLL